MLRKLKGIEDSVKLEIKNAFLNLQVARKNIPTANKSLGQAQENWRITDLQYLKQIATSTDVLDARVFLTQAQTNYYDALYGYMISVGELERAVGRMWSPTGKPVAPLSFADSPRERRDLVARHPDRNTDHKRSVSG